MAQVEKFVERVRRAVKPEEEIYDVLEAEHREVAELMETIEASEDEEERAQTFAEMRLALLPHARAEEAVVYPRLREEEPTRELAMEAAQEHQVVSGLVRELDEMATHGETWAAKFKVLKENVEHHVEEEENELFAQARTVISDEEARELAKKYREAKEREEEVLDGG